MVQEAVSGVNPSKSSSLPSLPCPKLPQNQGVGTGTRQGAACSAWEHSCRTNEAKMRQAFAGIELAWRRSMGPYWRIFGSRFSPGVQGDVTQFSNMSIGAIFGVRRIDSPDNSQRQDPLEDELRG